MSLCSAEISLFSVPRWNRPCSVFKDDAQNSVLLFSGILLSPLNKSLLITTSDSYDVVSVGEYKYGDITSNSKLHSLSTRIYHLETLAELEVETAMIRVDWFRSVLDELLVAKRYFNKREMVALEKEACER
ncbi:hypothetical protein CARUB_v10002784mg, partial [Capsella rubella]